MARASGRGPPLGLPCGELDWVDEKVDWVDAFVEQAPRPPLGLASREMNRVRVLEPRAATRSSSPAAASTARHQGERPRSRPAGTPAARIGASNDGASQVVAAAQKEAERDGAGGFSIRTLLAVMRSVTLRGHWTWIGTLKVTGLSGPTGKCPDPSPAAPPTFIAANASGVFAPASKVRAQPVKPGQARSGLPARGAGAARGLRRRRRRGRTRDVEAGARAGAGMAPRLGLPIGPPPDAEGRHEIE